MVKKIGDIVLIVATAGSMFVYTQSPSVHLVATNREGSEIAQVQVGVPFYLTASVSGNSRTLPAPVLTGVENSYIKAESTSQDMSMINGAITARVNRTYTIVVPQEGDYTFGPARCNYNNQEILSDAITIHAAHKTQVSVDKKTSAFGTLFFSKKEVFYQEPVECIFRFYYSKDGIRLHDVSQPVFNGCKAEPVSSPISGSEVIDGVSYRYLEWRTIVYPSDTATVRVAPLNMRYTQPIRRHHMSGGSLFGDIFDMMGGFEEAQELYTNSAELRVNPLPSYNIPVHAVGSFSEFNAHLNTTNVQIGEGIILTLEIVGQGNLFSLMHPSLELPDKCTFYEGNSNYQSEKKPPQKTFEYVLQAHEAGTYTFPGQTLTYFDLAMQTYKTITTEPLTFTVTGSVPAVSKQESTFTEKKEELLSDWEPNIISQGLWKSSKPYALSWVTFLLLSLIPGVIVAGMILFKFYKKIYDKRSALRRYQAAFKTARKQLELARRRKYYGHVYSIFMHMFSERLHIDVKTLTEEVIETHIASHISPAQMVHWRLFYVMMSEAAFAHTTQESDAIFTQAFAWLHTFERIL